MATRPEDVLNLPGMTVRAPWTPESGREPTDEELWRWSTQQMGAGAPEPEEITAPYTAPPGEVAPQPQPPPEPEPWTPESGREPTDEELRAWSGYQETAPEEPLPAREPTREELLRQTPGITGITPEEREARILGIEPVAPELEPAAPLPEPEPPITIEPWDPESGVEPTDEQLMLWSGLDPEDPAAFAGPIETTAVNPINLPPPGENADIGRMWTALGNFTQSAGQLLSAVPKAVQLWFAPDTELLGWMDEMDRIDAMPDSPERFDARVKHISLGMQKYGTKANLFTAPLLDMYIEGPENKGEALAFNRRRARAEYLDELRKTIDRPLYRAGEAFDQMVRDTFPANPEYQDEWWASKIPSGLGSVVGYMGVFATTRRPTAAVTSRLPLDLATRRGRAGAMAVQAVPTAGLGITVQQSFAFENALRGGADIDVAFDAMYATETTLAGASEAVPIATFFNRADKMTGGVIKDTLKRMMIQGTEEGIQEGFQTIMENMVAADLYDPERQLWTGTGEAGAVGFTTGAIVEFIGSLFTGRRRAMQARAATGAEPTLEQQMEEARAAAEAAGGDALDQTEAASAVMAEQGPWAFAQQGTLKERLQAAQELRAARPTAESPLAEVIQAEANIARVPFEQKAEAVAAAVAEEVAAAKELAFTRAEEEAAVQREAEIQEAEVQRAMQETEREEAVAEAVEAQEVAPTTIGEAIEPEVREGLERMKAAARARKEPTPTVEEVAVEEVAPTPALPPPAARVTPEGEVLPPSEVAVREEERAARRAEAEAEGRIERPFVAEEPALPGERPAEETKAIVDAKANEAATSPLNDKPMPTQAQLETGQYEKGELKPTDTGLPGATVAIENPAGSVREGVDATTGKPWTREMKDHYGYIRGTESAEGPTEQLDAFIGDDLASDMVFVVDQVNQETGAFDEHKVMIGYPNQMAAMRAYKRNYSKGWQVGPVTPMTKEQFTGWLERGDQTQPVSPRMREEAEAIPLTNEEEFRQVAAEAARRQGRRRKPVIRYRAEEGEPVTTEAAPYGRAYDFAGMSRGEKSSLMTFLADRYDRVEARAIYNAIQEGKVEAVEDPAVQEWIAGREEVRVVQAKEAKQAVKQLTAEMPRINATVTNTPFDASVPEELQRAIRARGAGRAKGVYYNGKLYIFANNHESTEDVVRTMLHEGVAHHGLRVLYKNEDELNQLLDRVYDGMLNSEIEAMRARSRAYANIDLTTPEGQREMAEEHIAHLAETDPQQSVVQQIVSKIRNMLRSVGLELEYTNDDITAILADARRELRKTVPLARINVVSQVEVAETGEVIEVEEQADVALRQLEKRQGVIQQLRECQA